MQTGADASWASNPARRRPASSTRPCDNRSSARLASALAWTAGREFSERRIAACNSSSARPVSGGKQHLAVVGAAGRVEVRTAVALDKPVCRTYPLRHSLVLSAAAIGVHHLAGGENDGV